MTTTTTSNDRTRHIAVEREAIAQANSHVSNVGLPLYTHIAELLREALQISRDQPTQHAVWVQQATDAVKAIPEPQYLVMNRSGLYLSKLGTTSAWVLHEADAEIMGRVDAQLIARIEGASAVPIV